jgi:hypothetical protein
MLIRNKMPPLIIGISVCLANLVIAKIRRSTNIIKLAIFIFSSSTSPSRIVMSHAKPKNTTKFSGMFTAL